MAIAYNTSIIRNGLVLHLDAANVKSYPGTGTTWFDLSGNGNNGTLVNGPSFINNSISFDGVDDSANAPATFSLTGMTLNLWVYLDDTINWGTRYDVFVSNIAAGTNGRFLFYREDTTILTLYMLFPSSTTTPYVIQVPNANTIFTGKWKNITITSNTVSTNTTVNLYLDGILFSSLNVPEAATATNSSLTLMRSQSGLYTKGKVSSTSIYSRALSAQEIKHNFEALRGRYGI